VVECNLTALCLQYLTFECFEHDIDSGLLRVLVGRGYLVFQDYAIASWSYHLRATVRGAEELITLSKSPDQSTEAQDALQELDQALQDFATRYEEDLSAQNSVQGNSCDAFMDFHFYHVLRMVFEHVKNHQEKVRVIFCYAERRGFTFHQSSSSHNFSGLLVALNTLKSLSIIIVCAFADWRL